MKLVGAVFVAGTSLAVAAVLQGTGQRTGEPASRHVLEAHLSHGIGASPFDSDIWHDELNATLVVRSRLGATIAELQQVAGDQPDLSVRLMKLQHDGFLRSEGDRVRATFPILVGQERDTYLELVSRAAATKAEALDMCKAPTVPIEAFKVDEISVARS